VGGRKSSTYLFKSKGFSTDYSPVNPSAVTLLRFIHTFVTYCIICSGRRNVANMIPESVRHNQIFTKERMKIAVDITAAKK
jgi:hypothetical protein